MTLTLKGSSCAREAVAQPGAGITNHVLSQSYRFWSSREAKALIAENPVMFLQAGPGPGSLPVEPTHCILIR